MKQYKIEVHSLGYEDYSKIVVASSLREAKKQERQAKVEWCDRNAIDSSFELPFTRIIPLPVTTMPTPALPTLTPEQLKQAREWLADCVWGEGEIDFNELPDSTIVRGIARHWDGGLVDFLRCCD